MTRSENRRDIWRNNKKGPKRGKENSIGIVGAFRRRYKEQVDQASTSWLMIERDERLTYATKERLEENAGSKRKGHN
jgi:hypothetical protein